MTLANTMQDATTTYSHPERALNARRLPDCVVDVLGSAAADGSAGLEVGLPLGLWDVPAVAVNDTVLVPPMTSPAVPALISVPSTVMAGPPGNRVVPSTMIALPVPEARMAVIVLLPRVMTACEAAAVDVDPVSDQGTVCVPPITSPALPALTTVPLMVAAGPPSDKVVPSMRIALPVPEGKKAVIGLPSKVKIACEAVSAEADPKSDRGIVCVPPTTSPALPALTIVPLIVAAGPPGDRVVPSTTIALLVPEGKKTVIGLPPKVKTA
jgi:hypothetical protein